MFIRAEKKKCYHNHSSEKLLAIKIVSLSSVVTLITQPLGIFDESDSRFLVELQKQKKIFQIEIFTHYSGHR